MLVAFVVTLQFFLAFALMAVYVERKTAAFIQNRLGPYEVGPYGLLQPVADIFKLLQKREPLPRGGYPFWFRLAPLLPFIGVVSALGCVPFFPGFVYVETPVGVLLVVALLALNVLGILIAGWSSESKFATLGAFRAVGQLIAYEVPLGFALAAAVVVVGSLDFANMAVAQSPQMTMQLGGMSAWGGFFSWYVISHPLLLPVCAIFFLCALAQAHRTPFDLPEAENELVAGYHTEYSGFRWSLFMLVEYGVMLLLSALMVWLFFGAGHTPFFNLGALRLGTWTSDAYGRLGGWFMFWGMAKTFALVWLQMWLRWSLPRVRPDQLMQFCWRWLTPLSILLLYLVAFFVAL